MKTPLQALPFAAFLAYLIKTIIVPATIADSIVLLGLISYIILSQLSLKDKTLEKYDSLIKELKDEHHLLDQKLQALQSSNSAIKASMGMRQVMGSKI